MGAVFSLQATELPISRTEGRVRGAGGEQCLGYSPLLPSLLRFISPPNFPFQSRYTASPPTFLSLRTEESQHGGDQQGPVGRKDSTSPPLPRTLELLTGCMAGNLPGLLEHMYPTWCTRDRHNYLEKTEKEDHLHDSKASWPVCYALNHIEPGRMQGWREVTVPWMLKFLFLGAKTFWKAFWYWGAAVQGEWGAGVEIIMKNGSELDL